MKKEDKEKQIAEQKELQDAAEAILDGTFNTKEYYGITDGGLEAVYMVGYDMYRHKQYDKAKGIFNLLCMLDPTSSKYITACASTCFMLGDYINASQMFRLALLNGEYNPKTLLRLAECTIKLNQIELTIRYLKELISIAKEEKFKNDKETKSYVARAKMMITMFEDLLKQQLSQSEVQ